eukprot:6491474-Amphidinium_carterae.1
MAQIKSKKEAGGAREIEGAPSQRVGTLRAPSIALAFTWLMRYNVSCATCDKSGQGGEQSPGHASGRSCVRYE